MKRFAGMFAKIFAVCFAVIIITAGVSFASGGWGYDGQHGVSTPGDWSHVSESCNGKVQSPIDISTKEAKSVDGIKIDFYYDLEGDDAAAIEYLNNGHAIKAVPKAKRTIKIGEGEKYTLIQFHFHTLSEHKVDGNHYDMEMHLVHANDAFIEGKEGGKLAVIGVFIKEGKENEVLKGIFGNLPHAGHGDDVEKVDTDLTPDFSKLLPEGELGAYSYSGSLTTPGCNEIVSWLVLDKPIEFSKEQIGHYRSLYQEDGKEYHTNRPVQPLNERTVSHGKVTGERR